MLCSILMSGIDPKSNFLKNLIKGKSFSNEDDRKLIEDIVFLEKLISADGKIGSAAGWKANWLIEKHGFEYGELLLELKPELLFNFLEGQAEQEIKNERLVKKIEAEEKQRLNAWMDLGGEA